MKAHLLDILPVSFFLACGQSLPAPTSGSDSDGDSATDSDDGGSPDVWPTLEDPCAIDDVDAPSRLLLTTTDFATGAVSVADVSTGTVTPDVALATSDSIPFWHDGMAYLVNRFQFDYIDVLDPAQAFASIGQHGIEDVKVASVNPHSIAFGPDGLAYVTLFATSEGLAVLDLSRAPGESDHGRIDLSGLADDDGIPEAGHTVACGSWLFVILQRLDIDSQFAPTDGERIAVVDLAQARVLDFDAATGIQSLALLGGGVKQIRRDPADPDRHTLLALSTGIERIDLGSGTVEWAVSDSIFAAAGIGGTFQPQAFDVDDGTAYVAAYDADFSQVRIYRVGLDGGEPAALQEIAAELESVERTLEVVGDRLWYGSTRGGASGLWSFDITTDPPSPVGTTPAATGLPPYAMIAIP